MGDPDPSDPTFWSNLYQTKQDGWELGAASPPIARWAAAEPLAGKRVLVVGCGRGHEARALAARGARVVGLDLAPEAIAEARRLGGDVEWVNGDLFALPATGEYDFVIEHTCFCAIDPARRDEYVRAVAGALKPGGQLVGLFYAHGKPGGPPFDTSAAEVRSRFSTDFTVEALDVAPDSIERRRGKELFARIVRR
jgi:SAM-dependent methyltransferase